MKPTSTLSLLILALVSVALGTFNADAQQYKLRQVTSMTGMKSESTIFVKGMRKRTEGGGYMGMPTLVTIEQCDLRRIVKINDRKKMYFIEPFAKDIEETDEDAKPVAKAKPATASVKQSQEKGGTIYMYQSITDTGERKKMYGITARHVWSTQKIKPSADACMMKDSMIIKTDGWYIDLPQFNCPQYGFSKASYGGGAQKPSCQDRFVSKRSGKGRLGFPLTETKTMIMGNGQMQEFTTSLETLEFSTVKLDSMLFEIPPGYTLAASEEDLQDKFDVNDMIRQANNTHSEERVITTEKARNMTRIGVYVPTGSEEVNVEELQKHLATSLSSRSVEAVAVSSKDDAKKYNCDLVLYTDITKLKQGSKVGGLLKAIKNADPSSASSYNVEANFNLQTIDGNKRAQEKVSGKFNGKPDEAAKAAFSEGAGKVIEAL